MHHKRGVDNDNAVTAVAIAVTATTRAVTQG